jgi:hypothetical protein
LGFVVLGLLVERFEPLYGGTRSLYMKPSPVIPRTNLSRSQSVYASKRLEYNQPKFESLRKQITPHSTGPHSHHHACNDSNYESLYDRKPAAIDRHNVGAVGGTNLLMSGPPSYESNFYKTYDTAPGHKSHGHNIHHKRQTSDIHDNHANRILAQYETAKGLVDVDPKAALKSQNKAYYESEYNRGKEMKEAVEKKLIDTSPSDVENPPPPPRFRMQMPSTQNHHRYQPSGASDHSTNPNELSHHQLHHGHHTPSGMGKDHGMSSIPKKPYELLDNPTRKLLDFSPNHSQPNSLQQTPNSLSSNNPSSNSNNTYAARLLMTEKDSTYSRILEPLMNSKPLAGGAAPNGNACRMSPNDQFMYSYH